MPNAGEDLKHVDESTLHDAEQRYQVLVYKKEEMLIA